MIATKDSLEPKSSDYVMPKSRRVYVNGEIHPEVRVPMREISLAPTKDFSGNLEPNEPVRVYDTSGPWGDPDHSPDSSKGLTPLRAEWIKLWSVRSSTWTMVALLAFGAGLTALICATTADGIASGEADEPAGAFITWGMMIAQVTAVVLGVLVVSNE